MRAQRASRRTGFTLVEMLVSTALILFIMAIIAEALGAGSRTFTTLRTAGDLQNRLRGATAIMREDLATDHFAPPYGSNRGGPRLRDQRLDQPGYRPPGWGFFEFGQILPSGYEPGGAANLDGVQINPPLIMPPATDGEGLFSTRARSHWLKFTIRLPEGPASNLLAAAYHPALAADPTGYATLNAFPALAPMVYTRWAEVMYYLDFFENKTTSGGTPIGVLRRRVRLLPPKSALIAVPAAAAPQIQQDVATKKYPDVIDPILVGPAPSPPYQPNYVLFLVPGPEALNKNPALRIGELPPAPGTPYSPHPGPPIGATDPLQWRPTWVHPAGDDVLLPDVISFEVKAAWFNNPSFNAIRADSSPYGERMPPLGLNTDEPFSDLKESALQALSPGFKRRFGTGYEPQAPAPNLPPAPIDWDNPMNTGNVGGDPATGFLMPGLPFQQPLPSRINVRVLQIKLRIWDPRAEQARQVTIVQEV